MGIIAKALAVDVGQLAINSSTADTNLNGLVGTIIGWVMILAGIIAFFYLVFSGFTYLTAGGNPDAAKKGQQGIINALIGMVIIFLAWAIVSAFSNLLA